MEYLMKLKYMTFLMVIFIILLWIFISLGIIGEIHSMPTVQETYTNIQRNIILNK